MAARCGDDVRRHHWLLDGVRLSGGNAYLTTLRYNHDPRLTDLTYPAGSLTYAWFLTSVGHLEGVDRDCNPLT